MRSKVTLKPLRVPLKLKCCWDELPTCVTVPGGNMRLKPPTVRVMDCVAKSNPLLFAPRLKLPDRLILFGLPTFAGVGAGNEAKGVLRLAMAMPWGPPPTPTVATYHRVGRGGNRGYVA